MSGTQDIVQMLTTALVASVDYQCTIDRDACGVLLLVLAGGELCEGSAGDPLAAPVERTLQLSILGFGGCGRNCLYWARRRGLGRGEDLRDRASGALPHSQGARCGRTP